MIDAKYKKQPLTLKDVREKRSFKRKVKKIGDSDLVVSSAGGVSMNKEPNANAKLATAKALLAILKTI